MVRSLSGADYFLTKKIKAESHGHRINGAVHGGPGTWKPAEISSSTISLTLKPFPIFHLLKTGAHPRGGGGAAELQPPKTEIKKTQIL